MFGVVFPTVRNVGFDLYRNFLQTVLGPNGDCTPCPPGAKVWKIM